jgi:Leucine-rich repeat (LRR) protein
VIQSLFLPLQKLRSLFLSFNEIKVVEGGDLNVLPSLKEVALDHNQINEMSKEAFEGLQLTSRINNFQLHIK